MDDLRQYAFSEAEIKIILGVLRRARTCGFPHVTSSHCGASTLGWVKRSINWLLRSVGAEREPFKDPHNFKEVEVYPLGRYGVDVNRVDFILKVLSPTPTCSVCGSQNIAEDPAGYYCHAFRWDGAPLLCLDHPESKHDALEEAAGILPMA